MHTQVIGNKTQILAVPNDGVEPFQLGKFIKLKASQ